jgi:hypothetical protein
MLALSQLVKNNTFSLSADASKKSWRSVCSTRFPSLRVSTILQHIPRLLILATFTCFYGSLTILQKRCSLTYMSICTCSRHVSKVANWYLLCFNSTPCHSYVAKEMFMVECECFCYFTGILCRHALSVLKLHVRSRQHMSLISGKNITKLHALVHYPNEMLLADPSCLQDYLFTQCRQLLN